MPTNAELQQQIARLEQQNLDLLKLASTKTEPPKEFSSYGTLAVIGVETIALVFVVVKASFGRNVKTVDDTLKALNDKVQAHDHDLTTLKGDIRSLAGLLPEMKGALTTMANTIEQNRDKQAAFYRSELEKLDTLLRQEMTKVLSPDLSMRITELEKRLSAVETKPRKSR